MGVEPTYPPRLMKAVQAAAYLGVTPATLRTFKITKKQLGSMSVYDRFDLDAFASSLPTEAGENTCDKLFG